MLNIVSPERSPDMTEQLANPQKLVPFTKWEAQFGYPPTAQIRALWFNRKQNGFDSCVVRIGKRLLINPSRFFTWAESQKKES
jgi:hypothetical protein